MLRTISAAVIVPNRKVMTIVGDGGYGLIEWEQDNTYGGHADLLLRNPKWGLLAESFVWSYNYVDESTALLDTIKTALDRPEPSLIVVPIDFRENAILTKHRVEITMGL